MYVINSAKYAKNIAHFYIHTVICLNCLYLITQ